MSRLASTIRNAAGQWFSNLAPTPPQLAALAAAMRETPSYGGLRMPNPFAARRS